jgi:hypothetical protein
MSMHGCCTGGCLQQDYMRGHHERLPYDDSTMRSIYHVRDFEVDRLMQVTTLGLCRPALEMRLSVQGVLALQYVMLACALRLHDPLCE